MKFNKFKSREERLKNKLSQVLLNKTIDEAKITELIRVINDYEKNNLDTISKLKKDKSLETKKISGALRQTINAHSVITKDLIGSATKRIYGALLINEKEKNKKISFDIGTFVLIQICIVISISVLIITLNG
jgi:hypothetical protein